jgi:hypothetical protein
VKVIGLGFRIIGINIRKNQRDIESLQQAHQREKKLAEERYRRLVRKCRRLEYRVKQAWILAGASIVVNCGSVIVLGIEHLKHTH